MHIDTFTDCAHCPTTPHATPRTFISLPLLVILFDCQFYILTPAVIVSNTHHPQLCSRSIETGLSLDTKILPPHPPRSLPVYKHMSCAYRLLDGLSLVATYLCTHTHTATPPTWTPSILKHLPKLPRTLPLRVSYSLGCALFKTMDLVDQISLPSLPISPSALTLLLNTLVGVVYVALLCSPGHASRLAARPSAHAFLAHACRHSAGCTQFSIGCTR